MGKRLFIDCGGHDGCSVVKFLSKRPNYTCYSFEPNKLFGRYYKILPTTLIQSAVNISDGEVEFIVDQVDGDGSTIVPQKRVDFFRKHENHECPRERVPSTDLSKFVLEKTDENDYVVLKLDIEGAEYLVLDKMIKEGSIHRIKELYCEFHWEKMGMAEQEHDEFLDKLSQFVTVCDWDAYDFSIYRKKLRFRLFRILQVLLIYIRRLFS